jgi:hypothetical protein
VLPLPFCLRLRDGDYEIRYKKRVYLCHLRKAWSDFASGCNQDEQTGAIESEFLFKAITGEITKASNVEIEFDKKGFFRHTRFCSTVYLDESLKPEEIPSQVIVALLPLLNKLLTTYRYVTGEFHITEIQWQDLCMVRDGKIMPFLVMDHPKQGPQRSRVMGWFPGDDSPLVSAKPNVSKQDHKAIEKMLLEENFQFPVEKDLMLNAMDFTRQGRYGLAVFELGTALEVAINNLLMVKGLNEEKLKYSSFKSKYDRTLCELTGISLKDANNALFSAICRVWNIRSNFAHMRLVVFTDEKGNVIEKIKSKEQVEPLIKSAEQTLDFLDSLSH